MEINFKINQVNFILSHKFTKELEVKGFKILNKLGSGADSLVVRAINYNNEEYALLIPLNTDCESNLEYTTYNLVKEYQQKGILNYDYIVKLYGSISINSKLSEDINYCSNNNDITSIVEIQEIGKQTLKEKMFLLRNESTVEKVNFIYNLCLRLLDMFEYLDNKDLFYGDLHDDNIMFMNPNDMNTLIFIDINSILRKDSSYNFRKEINKFILDIFEEYTDVSIFKNKNESKIAIKIYNIKARSNK